MFICMLPSPVTGHHFFQQGHFNASATGRPNYIVPETPGNPATWFIERVIGRQTSRMLSYIRTSRKRRRRQTPKGFQYRGFYATFAFARHISERRARQISLSAATSREYHPAAETQRILRQ